MRTVYERRSYIPPWAWVAIALGALLVVLLVWLVAASTRPSPEERYGTEPTPSPVAPGMTPRPPVTTETTPETVPPAPSAPEDKSARVYIYEKPQTPPRVVAVPEGVKEPQENKGYESVDLPGRFTLSGKEWQAAPGALIAEETIILKDSGMRVEGHAVYVSDDDRKPFDALYIETAPGSGKYIEYALVG